MPGTVTEIHTLRVILVTGPGCLNLFHGAVEDWQWQRGGSLLDLFLPNSAHDANGLSFIDIERLPKGQLSGCE
jgi:hypothetical protein